MYNILLTHTEEIMAKFKVRTVVAIEIEVEADTADSAVDVANTKIYDSVKNATFEFFGEEEVSDEQGEVV